MQRHGKTAAGTQRWRCVDCALSSIRQRSDQRYRQYFRSFVKWLTGTREILSITHELRISRRQLSRRFELCWSLPAPASPPATEADHVQVTRPQSAGAQQSQTESSLFVCGARESEVACREAVETCQYCLILRIFCFIPIFLNIKTI
jgi:hypothetical protein